MAPYVEDIVGFGVANAEDTTIVQCPVIGTATPFVYTWNDAEGNP